MHGKSYALQSREALNRHEDVNGLRAIASQTRAILFLSTPGIEAL
jgi:hypothetical protein